MWRENIVLKDQLSHLTQDIENFQQYKSYSQSSSTRQRLVTAHERKDHMHCLKQECQARGTEQWICFQGFLAKNQDNEGVPHGSLILPTLFLLYINDVANTLAPTFPADIPTTIADHASTTSHVMQETIRRVNSWVDEWSMEINCSKIQAALD